MIPNAFGILFAIIAFEIVFLLFIFLLDELAQAL